MGQMTRGQMQIIGSIQMCIRDSPEDVAASIFQAVVTQTISGLACGRPIRGNVAFLGGPLQYRCV